MKLAVSICFAMCDKATRFSALLFYPFIEDSRFRLFAACAWTLEEVLLVGIF